MATLAAACAENEGLQVVTECPDLHSKIPRAPRDKILTACLERVNPGNQVSGQKVAEVFVYRHCNVDMLSTEAIVALKNERDALADFRGELETLAKALPTPIHSETHLQEHIEDLLQGMFEKWSKDRKNLSPVARRFFGEGMSLEIRTICEKMIEAALKPETGQHLVAGVTTAGAVGGSLGVFAGVGAGFAVTLVFRGYESWRKTRDAAKASPLRYLTKLQDHHGVTFSFSP
jgi:hypothetical protein